MRLFLIILFSLFTITSFSQSLANRKILTIKAMDILGSVNSGRTFSNGIGNTPNNSQGIRLTLGASIGKINAQNVAILYGLEIPLRFNHMTTTNVESNESEFGMFPSVTLLKMIPITPNVYWGSNVGIRAGYERYRGIVSGQNPEVRNTWEARVFYKPLEFIWYFRKNTAVNFGIWDGSISYTTATTRVNSSNDATLKTNSLLINGRFNITLGMQFILH